MQARVLCECLLVMICWLMIMIMMTCVEGTHSVAHMSTMTFFMAEGETVLKQLYYADYNDQRFKIVQFTVGSSSVPGFGGGGSGHPQ